VKLKVVLIDDFWKKISGNFAGNQVGASELRGQLAAKHETDGVGKCATEFDAQGVPYDCTRRACWPRFLGRLIMTLCPVALAVGCIKCPVVNMCPAKGIIGDYKKDAPPPADMKKKQ